MKLESFDATSREVSAEAMKWKLIQRMKQEIVAHKYEIWWVMPNKNQKLDKRKK